MTPKEQARGLAFIYSLLGARWRRSGGGPGGGCARRPVGILSPPVVGVGNPVAVLGLAR
jgi:hypothetical protein